MSKSDSSSEEETKKASEQQADWAIPRQLQENIQKRQQQQNHREENLAQEVLDLLKEDKDFCEFCNLTQVVAKTDALSRTWDHKDVSS